MEDYFRTDSRPDQTRPDHPSFVLKPPSQKPYSSSQNQDQNFSILPQTQHPKFSKQTAQIPLPDPSLLRNPILMRSLAVSKSSRYFSFSTASAFLNLDSDDASSDHDDPWPLPHRSLHNGRFQPPPPLPPCEVASSSEVLKILNGLRNNPNLALSLLFDLQRNGFPRDASSFAAIVAFVIRSGSSAELVPVFSRIVESREEGFDFMDVLDCLAAEGGESMMLCAFDCLIKAYVSMGMFYEASNSFFRPGRRGFFPRITTCNFLLNRLIECGRAQAAVALYKQLRTIGGLKSNDYTFTIVIKALCRMGELEEAANVFVEMEEAGVIPNTFAYSTYIEGLCMNRRTDVAHQLLRDLQAAKLPLNEYAYAVVIRGFCNESKLEEAERAFLEMEEQGLVPDAYCYGALIHGYCKGENLLKGLALHEDMLSKGIKTNCYIISIILQCLCDMGMYEETVCHFKDYRQFDIILDEVSYNIAVNALCKLGRMEEAVELLEQMKGKKMELDNMHYTTLISGYCLEGNILKAQGVVDEMTHRGIRPDIITYNILAGGLSRAGLVLDVSNLLSCMESQGIRPNVATYNAIVEGLCIGGKVEAAEEFFSKLEHKSAEIYAAMVNGFCGANLTKKAYRLFNVFSEEGKMMNKKICFKLLHHLLIEGDCKKALQLHDRMVVNDMGPSQSMYRGLIATICRDGKITTSQLLFDILIRRGLIPDVSTYTMMMKSYFLDGCSQNAFNLYKDMINKGVKLDVIAYTVLLDGFSKIELKSKKEEPEDMARDVFHMIYREMISKQIPPDMIIYTVLIDRQCKLGNLAEAEDLWSQMIEQGLLPDVATYTALISGCLRGGKVERANYLLKEMSVKGIPLDERIMSITRQEKLNTKNADTEKHSQV